MILIWHATVGMPCAIFIKSIVHVFAALRRIHSPLMAEFVLNKLKSRGFHASSLSTYDFSTLYTTLPHNLIKDKLVDLIERTFQREGSLYIAYNDNNAFFTSVAVRNFKFMVLSESV